MGTAKESVAIRMIMEIDYPVDVNHNIFARSEDIRMYSKWSENIVWIMLLLCIRRFYNK